MKPSSGPGEVPWVSRGQALEGRTLRLEPLEERHFQALWETALDPVVWKWMPQNVLSQEHFSGVFRHLTESMAKGTMFSFAIFDKLSGRCAGSASYLNLDRVNRRVEIGYTWLSPQWQRTRANTEAKYLLLRQAFEVMGCARVEFKTDALNDKSRAALKRIGAKEEGTLRRHMVVQEGRIRDSVYFSILDSEWPAVKKDLEGKMAGSKG